jgi:hypothetical protein
MRNPINWLNFGRVDSHGVPVPPKTGKGVMWAVASAVAILATGVLLAAAAANCAVSVFAFSMGAIPAGIMQVSSTIMTMLAAGYLAFMASECIKNAHHHLHKRRSFIHISA